MVVDSDEALVVEEEVATSVSWWFVAEKHPDEKYFLFGKGGGEQLTKEYGVPLLSQIPLVADVCELSDQGKNIFNSGKAILIKAFEELAQKIDQVKEVPA